MNNRNLNIRASKVDYNRAIDIFAVHEDYNNTGLLSVGKMITFDQVEEGLVIPPLCSISFKKAQQLMDDLWDAGIKPTEGHGSTGQIKPTEYHLKDMRKIVSKILKVEL